MKVAFLSESPADEAALRIFVEAILGEPIEPVSRAERTGGLEFVIRTLPPVLREIHYHRTADALVVGIDSDNSPVHQSGHAPNEWKASKCRWCQLRSTLDDITRTLRAIPSYPPILTAVAVPTPAIEAWYLFSEDSNCTEANWVRCRNERTPSKTEIDRLKRLIYDTTRPDLARETERATKRATALATKIEQIEGFFPNSFGVFAAEIRRWRFRDSHQSAGESAPP